MELGSVTLKINTQHTHAKNSFLSSEDTVDTVGGVVIDKDISTFSSSCQRTHELLRCCPMGHWTEIGARLASAIAAHASLVPAGSSIIVAPKLAPLVSTLGPT